MKKSIKKIILVCTMLVTVVNASDYNTDYINKNYSALTGEQKDIIKYAYSIGNSLVIGEDTYGLTLATFTLVESSSGLFKSGDSDNSFGLCHIQLSKARELILRSKFFEGMNLLTDVQLEHELTHNDMFNLVLTGINFKIHYEKWGSYRAAVVSHNGYNPYRGFYNTGYYKRFLLNMEIVKKVMRED